MSEVFDLDAVEAATHPDKTPFKFKFGGEEFFLPNFVDQRIWKMPTMRAIEVILGPDQFAALEASPAVFDTKRMTALMNAWLNHVGETDLGESAASTDSSKSTGRPSKRTSKGTTPTVR